MSINLKSSGLYPTIPHTAESYSMTSLLYAALTACLFAIALPAAALDRNPLDQTFDPVKAPRVDLKDLAVTNTAPAAPCLSTDGKYATDGTDAWEPSCFGAFLSSEMNIKVYPTRGTGRGPDKLPSNYQFTGSLIQGRGDAAVEKEANGQFINWECIGGAVSAKKLDSTNCTGQLISVRTRPGPNGEKPPTAWGFNVDLNMGQAHTPGQAWVQENDLNNFSGHDCYPGSNCISAGLFFNGVGSYMNTAWIYSGGGTTDIRTTNIRVARNKVTRVSGAAFRKSAYRLKIKGTSYRVSFLNEDELNGLVPIPDFTSPIAATWQNAMVVNGVLFQGENMASDSDFALNTSAYNAVRVAGNHHVGVDLMSDAARFGILMGPGQLQCFNGFDSCWSFTNGRLQYNSNGTIPLQIVSASNAVNGLRITNSGTGFGPLVEPQGNDTNVSLTLRGKGSGTVAVVGSAEVSGHLSANALRQPIAYTPPTATSSCTTGDQSWDANFEYRCVAPNTWKRLSLSTW